MDSYWHTDVIIIGAGLAGLSTAWHLRDRSVAILRPPEHWAASYMARGGIAAAVGEDDTPQHHLDDTVNAGAGLVDPDIADALVTDGLERMIDLFELSIDFDRDDDGQLHLGREALHSRRRIIHAAGDETGHHVTSAVRAQLRTRHDVTFVDGRALDLIEHNGRIAGVIFDPGDGDPQGLLAPATVLATGGAAGLFECTTTSPAARGDGIAMAARAGAALADLEFVQFHPTALACDERPLPLLSEAIRGQGATLVDHRGRPVMSGEPDGDLAGRDVISRTLWKHIKDSIPVYLDARNIAEFDRRFPSAFDACQRHGLDPATDRLPVTPAAHYHMGGVATDRRAATSVAGLWAVGEVASTGAHGANRLASNSLLEALVFGARAALDILAVPRHRHSIPLEQIVHLRNSWTQGLATAPSPDSTLQTLARLMWRNVGIVRSDSSLTDTINHLHTLMADLDRHTPVRLALECARAIAHAAWRRTESRGAHHRSDFPRPDPAFGHRIFIQNPRRLTVHTPDTNRPSTPVAIEASDSLPFQR